MNPLVNSQEDPINNQNANMQEPNPGIASGLLDGLSDTTNNIANTADDLLGKTTSAIDDATTEFSKPVFDITSSGKDFLTSNSLITKFVFVIGILLIFVFILRILIELVGYLMSPKGDVYLIYGTAPTNLPQKISVNPNDATSKPILRSDNRKHGIEFTYSIWLFVESVNEISVTNDRYNIVFNKGNSDYNDLADQGNKATNATIDGNTVDLPMISAPGLFFSEKENKLLVRMNYIPRKLSEKADTTTVQVDANEASENIEITDLPMSKWFNVMIKCKGSTVDVLINGTLTKRKIVDGIPKQNYYDVHVNPISPFGGYISNLKYYNRYLGTVETNMLINKGPNLKNYKQSLKAINQTESKYISLGWFFN